MKTLYIHSLIVITILSTVACSPNSNKTAVSSNQSILFFAAAGTRTVTEELVDLFEKESGQKVTLNFASSGTLARQIEKGAECEIYISANKKWINYLKENSLLENDSIQEIASNVLTVIAPKNTAVKEPLFTPEFDILTSVKDKITIGDPDFVPVGSYTKEVFDKFGWMKILGTKLILAKDVNTVLRYVEMGECDWGVVYYTEAIQSEKIDIIKTIPTEYHHAITFYVALLKDASPEAKKLYTLINSKRGKSLFLKHGFQELTE